MTRDIKLSVAKPLGRYLVEAGIVSSAQLENALDEQKQTQKRIGEILSARGWVKQETIDYVVEKIVLPERETSEKKLDDRDYQLFPQSSSDLPIYLSPRQVTQFLLVLFCILIPTCVLIEVGAYILPGYPLQDTLISLFDLDTDQTVPGIFSAAMLLLCSLLLGAIAYSKKVARDRYTPQWIALAIIFFYLSVDEAIGIHERISHLITGKFNPTGIFHYAWTIPGGIFVTICLLAFWRFINHLPPKTKFLFLVAGIIYVGGALIVEMHNGYYKSLHGNQPTYYAFTTVEESMEMLGIITFIYGLLRYISSYLKGISIRVNISSTKK